MAKYRFDMEIGHYVPLNEADEQTSTDQASADTASTKADAADSQTSASDESAPNLQSEEVAAMEAKLQDNANIINREITKCNNNRAQLQTAVSTATEAFNAAESDQKEQARSAIIAANAKYLQNEMQLLTWQKKLNELTFKYKNNILQLQMKANESMVRLYPGKYSSLNESNISQAKVYMTGLVGEESNILKGMTDFKHVFGETNLLYGKDKIGYFVVCIDQDDFNECYNALEGVGYHRDVIIDCVMPQLFNRKEMVL